MSSNYYVFSTTEGIEWPEYVSERQLQGDYLQKATQILDMALVALETYEGPRFMVHQVNEVIRKSIFLYEINAELIDAADEFRQCNAMILYEPWMKTNCIAQASFEFPDDEKNSMIVVVRNEEVPYYKSEEENQSSFIPRWIGYSGIYK